ncbi:MAG: glycosyltransferase family 39 protein [Solirubrobacterales bacterium]
MEAAALGRGGLSTVAHGVREGLRARSRAFWVLGGLTLLAAALRFSTLGLQSYHHDEIVTASRILGGDFWHAMSAVSAGESAPPLYYVVAWLWAQLVGTGEFGLRSVSALAGVATVPVAYLIAAELRGRRAGIAAAVLVAVNPMLLWYSQEARAYALFALFAALSLLFFVRALNGGDRRDFLAWGAFSALALTTHYFAVFPVGAETLWLLRRRGRASLRGLWIIVLAGLLLAPLALHQMSIGHAEWIGNHPLARRLWEAGMTFMVGETGDIIARPVNPLLALLPALLVVVALAILPLRGEPRERRAARIPLAIAATTIALPVLLALASPSRDYVLARNLMPALVPLLVAVAIALTARRAGRVGVVAGLALVAYSLGFCLWASFSPSLQRPDWDAVATQLGEPAAPRAIVTWVLGEAPLRYYLSSGAFQVSAAEHIGWLAHEVDLVSDGATRPLPPRILGPGFRAAGHQQVGRLFVRRYSLPGPGLAPIRLRALRGAPLGFPNNGVLMDGIGPR